MSNRHRRARQAFKQQAHVRRETIDQMVLRMLPRAIETGDYSAVRRFAEPATIKRVVREHARSLPSPARHQYHK